MPHRVDPVTTDTAPPLRVLLLDADSRRREQLGDCLRRSGLQVQIAATALADLAGHTHDFVILDRNLPAGGLDALRRIRQYSPVPLLLLADNGDEIERVLCLELGADDVVPPHCSPREIVARMRAILRRVQQPVPAPVEMLQAGPLQLWPQKRSALWQGRELALTSTEFSLLEVLARHQGHAVSKPVLSEQALARPFRRHDRTIDVHISNIRQKLGSRADGGDWIQTVRGLGYQLVRE